MTDQQKLEILCAYLPHGVEVESSEIYNGFRAKLVVSNFTNSLANGLTIQSALEYEAKLILRHPDDMADEELKHLANNWGVEFGKSILLNETPMYLEHAQESLRYLHSIHVDTFGAIEAGFAVRKEVSNG